MPTAVRPAAAALMAGSVDPDAMRRLNAAHLLGRWRDLGMIEPGDDQLRGAEL